MIKVPAYAGFYGGFEYAKRKLGGSVPAHVHRQMHGHHLYGQHGQSLPVSKLMFAGVFGGIMSWICCCSFDFFNVFTH